MAPSPGIQVSTTVYKNPRPPQSSAFCCHGDTAAGYLRHRGFPWQRNQPPPPSSLSSFWSSIAIVRTSQTKGSVWKTLPSSQHTRRVCPGSWGHLWEDGRDHKALELRRPSNTIHRSFLHPTLSFCLLRVCYSFAVLSWGWGWVSLITIWGLCTDKMLTDK